jgi:sister chromatid cohesion protein PDS5
MPSRLRQSAGRVADAADSEKQYDIPGLDFNQSITWRPGKAIPVADLLSRLKSLSTQLRAYSEDQVDSHKFAPLAQDLTNANLLGHKDKGVRAWALQCVVDVLKTCAPQAPFKESQLVVRGLDSPLLQAHTDHV